MGRKHKTVPRDETTQKLKDKIRRLESDKRRLLSELKTLQEAFEKSRDFISKKVRNLSVEELIQHSDKNLKEIEKATACKKCGGDRFTHISLPANRKIKVCTECKFRETLIDSSDIDNN